MTQDEIIEMANQAELCQSIWIDDADDEVVQSVIQFAKLVEAKERERIYFETSTDFVKSAVAAEREACAKVCEAREDDGGEWDIQQQCANAIRARGEA